MCGFHVFPNDNIRKTFTVMHNRVFEKSDTLLFVLLACIILYIDGIKFKCSVLSIGLNMCFGCSKEPSHRDSSFEYPQHMFWLRNKKNNFQLRTLIWGPD